MDLSKVEKVTTESAAFDDAEFRCLLDRVDGVAAGTAAASASASKSLA
jgi:hypothetical protein